MLCPLWAALELIIRLRRRKPSVLLALFATSVVDVVIPVHIILLYGDAKVLGARNGVKGVAVQLV